jgi:hypothetical protein
MLCHVREGLLVLGLGGSLCNYSCPWYRVHLFPTQLWELLYTYHVIKQCTEKETTSPSNFLLTIKLNYLHDLKIMLQCLLHHVVHYFWAIICPLEVLSVTTFVAEIGVPREIHRSVTSHWQTLSHDVVLITPHHDNKSNSSDHNLITKCPDHSEWAIIQLYHGDKF